MVEVIVWICMSVITQIVKKTEVDAKIIILALSIVVWTAFYFLKERFPEMIDVVYQQTLWAYAVSQVIYNYGIQLREERKEKKGEIKKK